MNDIVNDHSASGPKKRKTVSKKLILSVVSAILVVAAIGGAYYGGYKKGEKHGMEVAKKANTNPFSNIPNGNQFIPKYKTGEVIAVSKSSIEVKTPEKTEKITISDKTKLTRKTETLPVTSLKKGDKVTVFVGQDGAATRIVYKS
ncbi:MAG: hypothetical protein U0526_02835 [Candidatus Saccharibacteria bacterium]